jgi:hypothetical protein
MGTLANNDLGEIIDSKKSKKKKGKKLEDYTMFDIPMYSNRNLTLFSPLKTSKNGS